MFNGLQSLSIIGMKEYRTCSQTGCMLYVKDTTNIHFNLIVQNKIYNFQRRKTNNVKPCTDSLRLKKPTYFHRNKDNINGR